MRALRELTRSRECSSWLPAAGAGGRGRGISGALIPLLLLPAGPAAPRQAAAQHPHTFVVRFDNDILALRGRGAPPDHDYTHGLHVAAAFRALPSPLGRWLGADTGAAVETRVGIGQRIYTPRQDGVTPVPGERPYAGWLYVDGGIAVVRSGTEHRLGVELGMTGPPALGEPVQNGFHRLVGSTRQEGWRNQLRWEPAGLVRYALAWPREVGPVRVRPQVEMGLGTLWSGAAGGLELRLGQGTERGGLYGEGSVRQEWVARNLFLDGTIYRESVRAEKRSRVSEAAGAVGYRFSRWGVEYRFVVRGREYRAQPGPHRYGSVAVKWRN